MPAAAPHRHAELAGHHLVGVALRHQPRDGLPQVVGDVRVPGLGALQRRRGVPEVVEQVEQEPDDAVVVHPRHVGLAVRQAEQHDQRAVEDDRGARDVTDRADGRPRVDELLQLHPGGQVGPVPVLADDPHGDAAREQRQVRPRQLLGVVLTGLQDQHLGTAGVPGHLEEAAHLQRPDQVLDRRRRRRGTAVVALEHVDPLPDLVDQLPPLVDLPLDRGDQRVGRDLRVHRDEPVGGAVHGA